MIVLTRNTKNRCKDCGHVWRPQTEGLALKCPKCDSTWTAYAGMDGFSRLVLFGAVGIVTLGLVFLLNLQSCQRIVRSEEDGGGTIPQELLSAPIPGLPSPDAVSPLPQPAPEPAPGGAAWAVTVQAPRFPRVVMAARDLSVKGPYGEVQIARGQPIRLMSQQGGTQFRGAVGAIEVTLQAGDFAEAW